MLLNSYNLDQIPAESFLISCLQKPINLSINNKLIKKGRLILFRRFHYFLQMTLMSEKGSKENLDVPFPFKIEDCSDEGLLYFDYRLHSLEVETLPKITEKVTSIFFDKILEIQAV